MPILTYFAAGIARMLMCCDYKILILLVRGSRNMWNCWGRMNEVEILTSTTRPGPHSFQIMLISHGCRRV